MTAENPPINGARSKDLKSACLRALSTSSSYQQQADIGSLAVSIFSIGVTRVVVGGSSRSADQNCTLREVTGGIRARINFPAQRRRRRTDPVADFDGLAVLYDLKLNANVDPESQNIIEEQLALAGEALEQLTPRVREVFVLRKVYGFSHREIAERLGIAISTVEKHIVKGMLEMQPKSSLQKEPVGAGDLIKEPQREGGSGG